MGYERESKCVEFKLAYSKTMLKTVCAFANFHDGIIILGIKDDGTIVGIDRINEQKLNIENAINDAILPTPYYEFEIQTIEQLQVLLIKVYKGDHTPYTYQNKSYMRRDTATIATDIATQQNLILAGRNLGYEDLPATVKDLSFRFFENLLKRHYQVGSLSDDLMRTLGLIKNGEYNILAVLLSDDNPLPSSVVQLVAFNGQGVSKIKDRITLSGSSVLKQFDECMTFYQKHINVGEVIESAYRKTVEEVPLIAYREAVANMLVHRDYGVQVDARIEIFSDRIEIVSPGGLPLGMMTEEYTEGRLSKPRNRQLSDVFLRVKIIEKLATGVRRIKEQYLYQQVKPRFIVSDHAVVVVLPFIKDSSTHGTVSENHEQTHLPARELRLYNLIKRNPGIKRAEIQKQIQLEKSQTIELLNNLRNSGRIMKIGNGPSTGYKVVY